MHKRIELFFVVFIVGVLAACGDTDGDSKGTAPEGGNAAIPAEDVYESEDDLPGCMEKFEGKLAFVEEGSVAFKCEDGR